MQYSTNEREAARQMRDVVIKRLAPYEEWGMQEMGMAGTRMPLYATGYAQLAAYDDVCVLLTAAVAQEHPMKRLRAAFYTLVARRDALGSVGVGDGVVVFDYYSTRGGQLIAGMLGVWSAAAMFLDEALIQYEQQMAEVSAE